MKKYINTIIVILVLAGTCFATDYIYINNHRQNVVVKQKKVEFDADTYLGLEGYHAVIDRLKEKSTEKALDKETLNKLLDLVKTLIEQGKGVPGTVPSPAPTQPVPTPAPKPEPKNNLDAKVFSIFSANCKQCHNENHAEGGLKLVGTDAEGDFLYDLPLYDRVSVHDRTYGVGLSERGLKQMPIGGHALADTDVETLRLWMIAKAGSEKGKAN